MQGKMRDRLADKNNERGVDGRKLPIDNPE